jgi:hypothetical protein
MLRHSNGVRGPLPPCFESLNMTPHALQDKLVMGNVVKHLVDHA